MTKISIDEFCRQWVKDIRFSGGIGNRFELNILDFTTLIGDYSKRFFMTSFMAGGFYGTGKSWKPRESRWGKKHTHPVMIDTGTLKASFKSEVKEFDYSSGRGKNRKRGNLIKYYIWTDERSVPVHGKRGRKKGRYQSYSAVHNSDPNKTNYTVNQYSKRKPEQRQFIGFNPKLDADLNSFIPILFRGFPFP